MLATRQATRLRIAIGLALTGAVPAHALPGFDPASFWAGYWSKAAYDKAADLTKKADDAKKAEASGGSCDGGSGGSSSSDTLAKMAMMQAMQAQQAAAAAQNNKKRDEQSKSADAAPPPPAPPAAPPPPPAPPPPASADLNVLNRAAMAPPPAPPSPGALEQEVLNLSKIAMPNFVKAEPRSAPVADAPPATVSAQIDKGAVASSGKSAPPSISDSRSAVERPAPEDSLLTPSTFPRFGGVTAASAGSPSLASAGGVTGGGDSVPAGLPSGSSPSLKRSGDGAGRDGGGGGDSSTAAMMSSLLGGAPPMPAIDPGGEVLDLNWNRQAGGARKPAASGPRNLFEYASLRYRRLQATKPKKLAAGAR